MEPKPLQKPYPPIWFGAHVRDAMVRGLRHGDGFIAAGASTLEEARQEIPQMVEVLKEEGRDLDTFPRSKRLYIHIDDNEQAALDKLRPLLSAQYGPADIADRIAVYGSPAHCAETINELHALGLTEIFLHPMTDSMQQMELIATRLAPLV